MTVRASTALYSFLKIETKEQVSGKKPSKTLLKTASISKKSRYLNSESSQRSRKTEFSNPRG